jgi:hypothetical protein
MSGKFGTKKEKTMSLNDKIVEYFGVGRKISKSELIDKLLSIRGAKMAGILVRTEPPMKKRNNPYAGRVVKVSNASVALNFNYEGSVNRRLEKEGKETDFHSKSNWHEAVLNTAGGISPLAKHKTNGNLYLRVMPRTTNYKYLDKITGQEIPREEIEPFLQKKNFGENQGVDDPVKFAVYSLDNVIGIKVDGETLLI